jgi:hypothetical protein
MSADWWPRRLECALIHRLEAMTWEISADRTRRDSPEQRPDIGQGVHKDASTNEPIAFRIRRIVQAHGGPR